MNRKKKINKCLLISFLLGVLYCIYIVSYMGTSMSEQTSMAGQVGIGLAATVIMPHLVCTVLATIFNGLGVFMRESGFALVGAILYSVALVLFIPYFMFVIIELILSFIGYGQLKKNNKKVKTLGGIE